MRKRLPLVAILLAALVIGCGRRAGRGATETLTPTESGAATATSPPETTPTPVPSAAGSSTETRESAESTVVPAVCVEADAEFPLQPNLPPVGDDDHIRGPSEAEITLIEYSDFQCPACAGVQPLVTLLEETYGDDLRLVFRHFPLSSIHPLAVISAEASEAAGAQGAFWEMHDRLYADAQEWSTLGEDLAIDVFVEFATDLGLDADRFRSDLEEHTYRERVEASYEEAVEMGLRGTPTFIVNGRTVPMGVQVPAFIELIQSGLPESYDEPPAQVIDPAKQYEAAIMTSKGQVVIQLLPERAPVNVNTFAYLAQDGWYDGQAFFFVRPDVVAYSGDPTNMGMVLPFSGFACGDEIHPGTPFDEAGIVAMFTPEPGRNSGLFFITMDALPELNGQYTVIGRVVEGLDVVRSLAAAQPGDGNVPDSIVSVAIEES